MFGRKQQKMYALGVSKLPIPTVVNTDNFGQIGEPQNELPSKIPERMDEPTRVVTMRMEKSKLDRQFMLHGMRNGSAEHTLKLGRVWSPWYEAAFSFRNGYTWGDAEVTLEPIFAGLTEEAMERQSVNALANLPFAFAGTRASDFTAHARYALRDLVNRPFNAIRLLYRLCVLYLTSRILEQDNEVLDVVGVTKPPLLRFIRGTGEFSVLLSEAAASNTQVAYVEMERMIPDPMIVEMYYLAMTGKIEFTTRHPNGIPAIAKFWPVIENAVVAVYGRNEMIVRVGRVESATVWTAIELFTQMYGMHEQLNGVLMNLATFINRPEGDTVFVGHNAIEMALPPSRMEAAAAGPLAASVRGWEKASIGVPEPKLQNLMWEGSSRYMLWALANRDLAAELGGYAVSVSDKNKQLIRDTERLVLSGKAQSPMQVMAEKYMKEFGWENALSMDLRSVIGATTIKTPSGIVSKLLVPIRTRKVPQWEEMLPYTDKVPVHSAIASKLYPASPKMSMLTRRWMTAMSVDNRHDNVYAYYSMAHLGVHEFAYVQCESADQTFGTHRFTLRKNYRDGPADMQLMEFWRDELSFWRPVFRVNDTSKLMEVIGKARKAMDVEWFVDRHHEFISNGTDAMYTMPSYPQGPADVTSPELEHQRFVEEKEIEEKELVRETKVMEQDGRPDVTAAELTVKPPSTKVEQVKHHRVRRDVILDIMGEGVRLEWLDKITDIKDRVGPNEVKISEQNRVDAQKALASLLEIDVRDLPQFAAVPAKTGLMMKQIASALTDLVPHVPPGSCQVDIYRTAETARQIGAVLESTGGISSAAVYRDVTGKMLPEGIPDTIFDEALRVGIHPGEIIHSKDADAVRCLIEDMTKALTAEAERKFGVKAGLEEAAPPDPQDKGKAKIDEPSTSAITEVPILETTEHKAEIEIIPEDTKPQDFGGLPSSQESGVGVQPSESTPPASTATLTSQEILQIPFEAAPIEPSQDAEQTE
jgi:hypothetical protein